jgi:hypothetical protein
VYIYLDTSHLQKWQQGTLSPSEISILDKLKASSSHKFVISLNHIFDITDRENPPRVLELAKFLDQLPLVWLRNPVDLKQQEIKNSINYLKKIDALGIKPFVNDYIDTMELEISSALAIALHRRGASIETIMKDILSGSLEERKGTLTIEQLRTWADANAVLINGMSNPEVKEKQMQKNIRRVLSEDVNKFNLVKDAIDAIGTLKSDQNCTLNDFVNHVIKNPHLIPSIWCAYYTQHFMHRNTGLHWKKSHLEDLNHLAALPYVDYLSVDAQIYEYSMQALKFAKRHLSAEWNKKLIKSVDEIIF